MLPETMNPMPYRPKWTKLSPDDAKFELYRSGSRSIFRAANRSRWTVHLPNGTTQTVATLAEAKDIADQHRPKIRRPFHINILVGSWGTIAC